MNQQQIIAQVQKDMKKFFQKDCSGHDWFHIERVHRLAKEISASESNANLFIVELTALLHDRYDKKLFKNVESERLYVQNYLVELGVDQSTVTAIILAIDSISFNQGNNPNLPLSIEAKIVQDADRLDAIGAIGIARTFAFAGSFHEPIYLGEQRTNHLDTNVPSTAIGHFYDKLLRLKNFMHTKKAKEIAESRQKFMENFLENLYSDRI